MTVLTNHPSLFEINCPLSQTSEVESLIQAGADKFYTGLIPSTDRGGMENFVSRRSQPENNFVDFGEFESARKIVANSGKEIFLTVNEHFYQNEIRDVIFDLLDELFDKPGIGGVILAEIGFVTEVHARYPDLAIVAGTGLALFNSAAIEMFQRLGVSRVVLPRSVSVSEMAQIAAKCPQVDLEAFILNDRCPNIDGLCNFVHSEFMDRKFPNQCKNLELVDSISVNKVQPSPLLSKRQFSHVHGFEVDACGACSLKDIVDSGVSHVKIVGRDRSPDEKLNDVKFVSHLRTLMNTKLLTNEEFRSGAKAARRNIHKKTCDTHYCYYGK